MKLRDDRQYYTFADPLVEGLARRLPAKAEPFTKAQQDNWIELAEKILAVIWGETP